MLRFLSTAIIFSVAAQAGIVDITTLVSASGQCDIGSNLITDPVSLSNSCGEGGVSAYASLGPILDSLYESGGAAGYVYTGPGAGHNVVDAKTDITDTQGLIISGGTGQGTLSLEFVLNGEGQSGYEASIFFGDSSFTVNGVAPIGPEGGLCPYEGLGYFGCGPFPQEEEGIPGAASSVNIPFTFDTPFLVTQDLSSGAEGEFGDGANYHIQSMLYAYTITQNGAAVPGATLTDTPEPSEVWPGLLLLAGLGIVTVRRNRRCSPATL